MPTLKIVILSADQQWKTVSFININIPISLLDHFARDNFLEDDTSGLFGILDGHGGGEVAKYCVKSIPDVNGKLSLLCDQTLQAFDKFYDDNENNIEKLFQLTFSKVDDELRMKGAQDSGSTACVCFVRKENSLY